MKNIKLALILGVLLPQVVLAQEISPTSIKLFKTDVLQAPQSRSDYFPFVQMDLSKTSKTFLLALCEYDITWADAENDSETIEYTFQDLSLLGPDSEELKPIGEFTADQRLTLKRDPKHSKVKANEKWGAKTLRFGALFVVEKSLNEFTVSFAGKKAKATASTEALPRPSDFAKIEIVESKFINSAELVNSNLKRRIPGLEVTLSSSYGKLLAIKTKVFPQAPNVMGGECRYIFKPSDFMLGSEGQILKPLGTLLNGNFVAGSICNVSRNSVDELKKTSQELTLIFLVQPGFTSGELTFMGDTKGKVSAK